MDRRKDRPNWLSFLEWKSEHLDELEVLFVLVTSHDLPPHTFGTVFTHRSQCKSAAAFGRQRDKADNIKLEISVAYGPSTIKQHVFI